MNFAEWVIDEIRREVALWLAAPTLTSHTDEGKQPGVLDRGV
jgi:hypothetical protein